jgi:hypothetical protein
MERMVIAAIELLTTLSHSMPICKEYLLQLI